MGDSRDGRVTPEAGSHDWSPLQGRARPPSTDPGSRRPGAQQYDWGTLEELILLLLDSRTHRIHVDEWTRDLVVGGAILLDLVFARRIAIGRSEPGMVSCVEAEPTGNDVLDRVLSLVADSPEPRNVRHWIELCAGCADRTIAVVFAKLTAAGMVRADVDGHHVIAENLLDTGRYPTRSAHSEVFVKARLSQILRGALEPAAQDVALICLAEASGELQRQMEHELLQSARARIGDIVRQDPSCVTVTSAVRDCFTGGRKSGVEPSSKMPSATIFDLLSPTMRAGELGRWLAELSRKYGPVFNLPQPGNRQVVVASAVANHWFEKNGWKYLHTRDYVAGYEDVYRCPGSILGSDGPDHANLRQMIVKRYPVTLLEDRIGDVFHLCREHFGRWVGGGARSTQFELQLLMHNIMADIALGLPGPHAFPELKDYEERVVKTRIMGILPSSMMRTSKMKRIRRQLDVVVERILKSHAEAPPGDRPPDVADEILLQHRADPQALPATHLSYAFVSVLLVGQNLGNLLSFALYELLRNPHLLEAIRSEADALFADGDPRPERFATEAVDKTERFFMEVCRLHPVQSASVRTARSAFDMCGHRIDAGESVLLAYGAPHYFEEHYRDADRFDPDRFLADRAEHLPPGVYAPFGCDGHRCPMSSWIRLLIIVNVLLMAHHLDIRLSPVDYRLRKKAYPLTSPDKRFRVRVAAVRRPLADAIG